MVVFPPPLLHSGCWLPLCPVCRPYDPNLRGFSSALAQDREQKKFSTMTGRSLVAAGVDAYWRRLLLRCYQEAVGSVTHDENNPESSQAMPFSVLVVSAMFVAGLLLAGGKGLSTGDIRPLSSMSSPSPSSSSSRRAKPSYIRYVVLGLCVSSPSVLDGIKKLLLHRVGSASHRPQLAEARIRGLFSRLAQMMRIARTMLVLQFWTEGGPKKEEYHSSNDTLQPTSTRFQNLNALYAHRRWVFDEASSLASVLSPIKSRNDIDFVRGW